MTDMSFTEGQSINNSIDQKLCSLSYITVDEIAQSAPSLSRGAPIHTLHTDTTCSASPFSTGTRKAAWSNHLHSCAGYSDRCSQARVNIPSREAGQATLYSGRVGIEKTKQTCTLQELESLIGMLYTNQGLPSRLPEQKLSI